MPKKIINSRIQNKHDTSANWELTNFVPLAGEIVMYDAEYDSNGSETQAVRFKIGDGTRTVNNLPFAVIDYNGRITALESKPGLDKVGTVTSVKANGTNFNPDATGKVDLGNIEGATGPAGKDALFFNSLHTDTSDPHNITLGWGTSYPFNRTPVVGELFQLVWNNTETGKAYICLYEVSAVEGDITDVAHSYTSMTLKDSVEITGTTGPAGVTPDITASASVENTTGTPTVEVTKGGTLTNPTFSFLFKGISGGSGPLQFSDTVVMTEAEFSEAYLAGTLQDDKLYLIEGETGTVNFVSTADHIVYNNANSGLTATNLQGAVDEINSKLFSGSYNDLTDKPAALTQTDILTLLNLTEEQLTKLISLLNKLTVDDTSVKFNNTTVKATTFDVQ